MLVVLDQVGLMAVYVGVLLAIVGVFVSMRLTMGVLLGHDRSLLSRCVYAAQADSPGNERTAESRR